MAPLAEAGARKDRSVPPVWRRRSPFLADLDLASLTRNANQAQLEVVAEIADYLLRIVALFGAVPVSGVHPYDESACWERRFPVFEEDAPVLALARVGDSGQSEISEEHDRFLSVADR